MKLLAPGHLPVRLSQIPGKGPCHNTGKLKQDGVEAVGEIQEEVYGKSGWILDPEGNWIELGSLWMRCWNYA